MREDHEFPGFHDAFTWCYQLRQLPRHHRHHHSDLEWNLSLGGTASYQLDDRQYSLASPSLIWLFPGQAHRLVDTSPDFQLRVVVFRQRVLSRRFPGTSYATFMQRNPPGQWCRPIAAAAAQELEAVLADCQDQTEDRIAFDAGLVYATARAWRLFHAEAAPAMHPLLRRAELVLAQQPALDHAALAAAVGTSADRLARICRQQQGCHLTAWRNRQRLAWLKRQWRPGIRLKSLAEAAGFSMRQLQRCCQQFEGAAPRQVFRV